VARAHLALAVGSETSRRYVGTENEESGKEMEKKEKNKRILDEEGISPSAFRFLRRLASVLLGIFALALWFLALEAVILRLLCQTC